MHTHTFFSPMSLIWPLTFYQYPSVFDVCLCLSMCASKYICVYMCVFYVWVDRCVRAHTHFILWMCSCLDEYSFFTKTQRHVFFLPSSPIFSPCFHLLLRLKLPQRSISSTVTELFQGFQPHINVTRNACVDPRPRLLSRYKGLRPRVPEGVPSPGSETACVDPGP